MFFFCASLFWSNSFYFCLSCWVGGCGVCVCVVRGGRVDCRVGVRGRWGFGECRGKKLYYLVAPFEIADFRGE